MFPKGLEVSQLTSEPRIRVTYELRPPQSRSLDAYARDIAVEQTVEVPEECITPELDERVVGRVERIEPGAAGLGRATISYAPELVGDEVPQLLNLLMGNVSLYAGVRIVGLEVPAATAEGLGGPAFGVPGLRDITGAKGRPLLCTPAKPLGLDSRALARRCEAMARGGADIIKDDHSIADQRVATFEERVTRCQAAVESANAATGGSTAYFPNVSADRRRMERRLELARDAGCQGILLNSVAVGLDALRWIGSELGLAAISHLTMTGLFFAPEHGVAPPVFYGQLLRLVGADGVIFPNPGTRFPLSREESLAVHRNLTGPCHELRPALPMAGGGVDAGSVAEWARVYGPDTAFLVGGSVLRRPDLEGAVAEVRQALEGSA